MSAYTFVTVAFTFDSPVSITAPESASLASGRDDEESIDLPIARDPRDGTPVLPGSSIAGALRSHLDSYLIDSAVGATASEPVLTLADLVMGSPGGEDLVGSSTRSPSAIRVIHVQLKTPSVGAAAITGLKRTAVSRKRAAAEDRKLFSREQLESGTTAIVKLRIDRIVLDEVLELAFPSGIAKPTSADLDEVLVGAISEWQPVIGGARTNGQGLSERVRLTTRRLDLSKLKDLTTWLSTSSQLDLWLPPSKKVAEIGLLPDWLTRSESVAGELLTVSLRIRDPLLICKSAATDQAQPTRGNGFESLRRGSSFVIPASSWKGVLRSRFEYILRTVGVKACESSTETCGVCPACTVFGGVSSAGSDDPARRGLLVFHDSLFGGTEQKRDHVAIDRFTGGGRDHALFWESVVIDSTEPILLRIDTLTQVPNWIGPLLWMAIRDLDAGLIGIGSGTTRGNGGLGLAEESGREEAASGRRKWLEELPALRDQYPAVPIEVAV